MDGTAKNGENAVPAILALPRCALGCSHGRRQPGGSRVPRHPAPTSNGGPSAPTPTTPTRGFKNRHLQLGTTLDGAGRLTANLTPECAEALKAVLEALGKKRGPEDDRTAGERFHDALQEG